MDIYGLTLKDAGVSEIKNALLEKLAADPTGFAGRLYYNTGDNTYRYYNGTVWTTFSSAAGVTALQNEVDALETSIGAAVNSSGVFQASAFSGFSNVTAPTSLTNVLSQLDAALETKDTLAELDDVTITAAAAGHVLYYTTEWVNAAPGATSGVQAYDAGLAALAVFNTNGILVQTADNTFAARSVAGTAGNIVVTNGDGVAGNPTVNLDTVSQADSGNFRKITLDGFGRVTGNTAVLTADITALVDNTYVNTSGDTMTGNLNMGGTFKVTGLATPTADQDAANKAYVDALTAGLSWKNAVRAATTGNVVLATDLENTDVVDDVTLATGDRVLVRAQTNPEENGIYVVQATGAAVRATDMNDAAEFDGAAVFVKEGTLYQSTGWTQTETVALVGTDDVIWSQFTGGAVYTWGTGLQNTGNTIFVAMGAGIVQLPTDEVGVDVHTAGGLFTTVDNSTSSTTTAAQLAVKLDGSTLSKSSSGVKVADAGITETQLAASVAGEGLSGGAGTPLALNASEVTVAGENAATGDRFIAYDASATATRAFTLAELGNGIAGEIALGDLSDVGTATPTNGHVISGDGSAFQSQKIFHTEDFTAATSWVVTHGLGQRLVLVQVYDASYNQIIPNNISLDSTTQCTISFGSNSVAGFIVVSGIPNTMA